MRNAFKRQRNGAGMRQLQLLALALCLLVLSIPIVTANTLNVVSITGNDGIEGVRQKADTVHVTASVNVDDGDTTDLEQNVVLIHPTAGSIPFDSCSGSDGSFSCQIDAPADSRTRAGRMQYSVMLFPGQPGKSVQMGAPIEVDGEGPSVLNIASSTNAAAGGSADITYTIKDRACSSGCSKCAGTDHIDFYVAETGAKIATVTPDSDDCQITETKSVSITALPNGEDHLCAIPIDHFGQIQSTYAGNAITIGSNCVQITKDSTLPEVLNFALTYKGTTVPVDYVSSSGTDVSLLVKVKTGLFPLQDNRIRVDLTNVGSGAVFIPCANRFGEYECKQDLRLLVSEGGSKQIPISLSDTGGNTATESYSANIQVDSDTPTVQQFRTGYMLTQGNTTTALIGRSNNTFIAQMQESGSGFDTNNAYVQIGSNRYRMNCSGNTCLYGGYTLIGSPTTLSATLSGADDVGHTFTKSATFQVDLQPPTLVGKISILSSTGKPYLVQGDTILINATLQDNTGMSEELSSADFSNLSANYDPHPVCINGASSACSWVLQGIFPTQRITANFKFADAANNILRMNVQDFVMLREQDGVLASLPAGPIAVARNANATTANFWDVKGDGPMPRFLDEDVVQVVPFRMWWDVNFKQRGGLQAKVVDSALNPASCVGSDFDSYVQDMEIVYPDPAKLNRFMIKTTFQRGSIDVDKLEFSCPVITRTVVGNEIYPPETDYMNFTIPVSRSGEISSAVQDEIKRTRNSWLVKAKWLATITKWLTLGKNICNLFATLSGLFTTLDTLLTDFGWLDKTPFAPLAKFFGGFVDGAQKGKNVIYRITSKFCKWVSCDIGIMPKYKKFVQNHKIDGLGSRRLGPGSDSPSKATSTIWPADPSNSLILSIVSLCIPGIFFNLQKARQIECQYLACLHDQVSSGTPLFVCSKLRNYGWCRYIMGEIFQLIPFAHFFQSFAGSISQLLSNPISAFLGISNWACTHWIAIDVTTEGFCHIVPELVMLGDVMNDIKTIAKTDWKIQKDSCEDVLSRIDEDSGGAPPDDGSTDEGTGPTSSLPDRGNGVTVG